jgi:outer membrane protein assembly factor BamB
VAVSGNIVFATTGTGQVFALTANAGKKVWDVNLNVPLRAAPTVEGEVVYVTSHDNRIFALSALNGALIWTHSGIEEKLSLLAGSSPAVANGAVAVPYSSGEVYVLRASDGRYVWHDTLTSPFSGQDPEMTISAIAAPPVIADGLLYVVGMNGGLSAYGLVNGQRYWRADLTTSQLPVVAGMSIFVLTDNGELVAMNRRDGAIRWVAEVAKGLPEAESKRLWVGPVLAGGRLIVASSDGYAVSVDPASGKQLAATELDDGVTLPPVVANGVLYFLTDGGRVIAFKAGTVKK